VVGAGSYGNISGSPSYTGSGDEHPQQLTLGRTTGCIVCIDKPVSIYSLHGSSVTVIEGAPLTSQEATVFIHSDGVNFGAAGRGFTITGGTAYGVDLDQDASGSVLGLIMKRNVSIAGNVDIGDTIGFTFQGLTLTDAHCPDPACVDTASITFSQNDAIDNTDSGFNLTQGLYNGGSIIAQGNFARGGGVGFNVPAGIQVMIGAASNSSLVHLTGNVAEHNGLGFYAFFPGGLASNTAANNSQAGFEIVASPIAFQGNTAVGNAGPGAIVQFFDNNDGPPTLGFKSFTQNNFYGNDRHRPALNISIAQLPPMSYDPGASAHCGVLNLGVLAQALEDVANPPVPAPLNANGNFWGTTHGPSATGAADAVGGKCDQRGGKTTATSFVTTGFGITLH
jgi:hypothetical protein